MDLDQRMKHLERKISNQLDNLTQDNNNTRDVNFSKKNPRVKVLPSGIKQYLIHKGDKTHFPKVGDQVTVQYIGKLEDCTVFDSSVKKGTPFKFVVGQGQVIKGWDLVITTLSKGQREMVYIPSKLAYGAKGAGNGRIPPNANLIFDIRLLSIQ